VLALITPGYFQVIARWHPWVNLRRLFEPFYNARVAYRISHGGKDWSAWVCAWAARRWTSS
jgi:hypothetical protein